MPTKATANRTLSKKSPSAERVRLRRFRTVTLSRLLVFDAPAAEWEVDVIVMPVLDSVLIRRLFA
jgi:hypothetical protein